MTDRCRSWSGRDGKEPITTSRRRRRLVLALVAALVAMLPPPPRAAAQPAVGDLKLIFSKDAKGSQGVERELPLRPNLPRQAFLHVLNEKGAAAEVQVELSAGGEPLLPAKTLTIPAGVGGLTKVIFGTAPVEKDGKPPVLAPVKSPLIVRLLDAKGRELETVGIGVVSPQKYVKVESISFDPTTQPDGTKNVLEVQLSPIKTAFQGPAARVDLVLNPDRAPSLKRGQEKKGRYSGLLRAGGNLVLRAENLEFVSSAEGEQGLIYLTVDGYQRAFTFVSTFLAERTKSTPALITKLPILRLVHPTIVKPSPKLPVIVEVDNAPPNGLGLLSLYRDFEDNTLKNLEDQPKEFIGDRAELLFCNPAGPAGALLVEGKVSDWVLVLDTEDVHGKRWLAAQMLDKGGKAGRTIQVLDSKEIPRRPLTETVSQIVEPVVLYDGKPDVTLDLDMTLPPPGRLPQLIVGSPLPLRAVSKDPSGITKAIFFAGKPPPDGKLPPTVLQAEGELFQIDPAVFKAELPVPTLKTGTVLVSVQMTNGVGETTTKTIRVELVDPAKANGAAGKFKGATITGTVVEGGQAVPGTPVTLSDDKGEYRFERVPPGAYAVNALRSASRTRGRTLVSVAEGQELVDKVEVKLTR